MTTHESPTWKDVDRSIRGLKVEQENTLLPETFAGQLERLVAVYTAIKPLLAMLAVVPLLPSAWRKAIALFNRAIEAVIAGSGDVSAEFKAGRDL